MKNNLSDKKIIGFNNEDDLYSEFAWLTKVHLFLSHMLVMFILKQIVHTKKVPRALLSYN
jgi:hypothetical protein